MVTDEIEIVPRSRPFGAAVAVPGSKSITNRSLILAAMAAGRSKIERALLSDDTHQMAAALRALGFEIELDATRAEITVAGHGGAVPAAGAELDAGGAGTAMRFLAGLVTLGRGRYRIDGNARMRQRPVGALLDALKALGASAISEHGDGCPPIVIDTTAQAFAGGAATIDASLSSQFVSALLMPAALWRDGLRLTVIGETARPFIAMTLRLMEAWGARSAVDSRPRSALDSRPRCGARTALDSSCPDSGARSAVKSIEAPPSGGMFVRLLQHFSRAIHSCAVYAGVLCLLPVSDTAHLAYYRPQGGIRENKLIREISDNQLDNRVA